MELLKVSAAVMGIEFSYAAETAFVSPTLLSIGVQHQHMTLVWALSPLVGFFLTPIMGSLSDRCRLDLGRRRPFIILFSIGIFIGKDKRRVAPANDTTHSIVVHCNMENHFNNKSKNKRNFYFHYQDYCSYRTAKVLDMQWAITIHMN